MNISEIIKALKLGEEVSNPETWKNRQVTTSVIVSLLGLVIGVMKMKGINLDISDADIVMIAGGIATVLGILNSLAVFASSKKVGFKSSDK